MAKYFKYFVTFNQGQILTNKINGPRKFLANDFYL